MNIADLPDYEPTVLNSADAHEYENHEDLVDVVIADGVAEIGSLAFIGCENLRSIVIPDSVVKIGNFTFEGCKKLVCIEMSENLSEIGDFAFQRCKSLTGIKLPYTFVHMGEYAFAECDNLYDIELPENLTYIGQSAFENCKSLKNITIPDCVEEIKRGVFFGCNNLKKVIIPDSVKMIRDVAFFGCEKLTVYASSYCEGREISNVAFEYSVMVDTDKGIMSNGDWIKKQIKMNNGVCEESEITRIVDRNIREIRRFGGSYDSCEILTKGKSKVENARNTFGRNATGKVVGLIDTSIMNSGKDGLLFTEDGIAFDYLFEKVFVKYSDIDSVDYDKNKYNLVISCFYTGKKGLKDEDLTISKGSFNIKPLKRMLEEIMKIVT